METKHSDYYRNLRPEMLDIIPTDVTTLLEVGCGEGAFAANLKVKRAEANTPVEVWGVEMDEAAAGKAAAVLDRVLQGDVAAVLPDLPKGHSSGCLRDGLLFRSLSLKIGTVEQGENEEGEGTHSRDDLAHGRVLSVGRLVRAGSSVPTRTGVIS